MDEIAHQISNAFFFFFILVLENGTSMWPSETDPMVTIGSRMLLQLCHGAAAGRLGRLHDYLFWMFSFLCLN